MIVSGVGASASVAGASGGKVYAFNTVNVTTQTLVAPANSARVKVTFHNPGTNDVIIAPQYVQTTGSNVANGVTAAIYGGGIRVFGNGGQYTIDGECQGAWYAIAVTGAGASNPLTVIDTNV